MSPTPAGLRSWRLRVAVARGRAVGTAAWGLETFGARMRGAWGCGLGPGVCGCPRDLGAAPPPNLNWSRVHFTALLGRRPVSSGSAHMRACHRGRASLPLWSTQHFIHSGLTSNGHRPLRRKRSRSGGGGGVLDVRTQGGGGFVGSGCRLCGAGRGRAAVLPDQGKQQRLIFSFSASICS